MKHIFTFLAILVTFTLASCSIFWSQDRRAQKHLAKAISLDPRILKSTDSVKFKDSVRIHDTTIVKLKDSVSVRLKDSTVIRPKDSLSADVGNPCDSIKGLRTFDYHLGTGTHRIHVWSDGKRVRFTSSVDSLVSTIMSRDTYIEHIRDSFATKEAEYKTELEKKTNTVVTKVIYKARWYQFILPGLIFLIIGFILGKVIKFSPIAYLKSILPWLKP